jgi:hypothetical protein
MEAIRTETKEQTTKIGIEHFSKLLRHEYFNSAEKLNFDTSLPEVADKINSTVQEETKIFALLDNLSEKETPFFIQGILQKEHYIMQSIIQEGNKFYLTFKKGKKAKTKFMFPLMEIIRKKYLLYYITGEKIN